MRKIFQIIIALFSRNKKVVIIKVLGKPTLNEKIKDIKPGQTMYAVPWAYDPHTKTLDTEMGASSTPVGTSCMPISNINGTLEVDLRFVFFGDKYKWH